MNALPRVVSLALPVKLPCLHRRAVPWTLPAVFTIVGVACLLLSATPLRAQSEPADGFPQIESTPLNQPDQPDSDSSANPDAPRVPSFTIQSIRFDLPGEHTTGASRLPTRSVNGYAGTVDLTCALETKTTVASPPECAMYPASVKLTNPGGAEPQILIFGVGTKLPPGVSIGDSVGSEAKWVGSGVAVLACGLLFGIPSRRRAWRSMVSAVLLAAALSSLSACVDTPKIITHGNYVFRVTGVDSEKSTIKTTATVNVAVL